MGQTLKLSIRPTRLLTLAEDKENAAPRNMQNPAGVQIQMTLVSWSVLNAQLKCDFQVERRGALHGPTNWWASCLVLFGIRLFYFGLFRQSRAAFHHYDFYSIQFTYLISFFQTFAYHY